MLFEKTTYLDDFPMNIRIMSVEEYPFHYHQDVEFVYVLKGEIRLKDVTSHYILKEGDFYTNNGHEVHAISATDKENVIAIIQISNRYFTRYFPELSKACFMTYVNDNKNPNLDVLRKMLLHILLDYSRKSFNYKSTCIFQMLDILKYIHQYFNLFAFEDQVVVHFKNDNPVVIERISRIINYVYANHSSKITLEELAEIEHLSTYYLSHLIREHMGISFQEFLCFARVEMSEILLLETDKKISAVAKDVGFSTTSYYKKFFTKWFGHSPEEHREKYLSHVLGPSRPAIHEILSENQAVNLIKRCLSAESDQESSSSVINQLHLSVDVATDTSPVMDVHHGLEVVITHEDYNVMGERLFNMLYELNASKVILAVRQGDSETTSSLISNRLSFLGYQVSIVSENRLVSKPSLGYDSIAAAIQLFQRYFDSKESGFQCRLRDQGDTLKILKGSPGCLTSCLMPKPSFYAYRLLQNIKGTLLYWGKYYYVVKNDIESEDSYTIAVLNYNDDIQHLCARSAGIHETRDVINAYMDELSIDFSIPLSPGQYVIAKYALSNANSIFNHMAHLGFPENTPLPDEWVQLLNTEPQTQVILENVEDTLNISASIVGAGINIIVVNKLSNQNNIPVTELE